jgi:hypothetical protein
LDAKLSSRWEAMSFPEGVHLKLVANATALEAAIREAREGYDLIVVGASTTWGTLPTPFGHRHEALARASGASLLVVQPANGRETAPDPSELAAVTAATAGV